MVKFCVFFYKKTTKANNQTKKWFERSFAPTNKHLKRALRPKNIVFLREMEKYGIFCRSNYCSVVFWTIFLRVFRCIYEYPRDNFWREKNVKICNKTNKKPNNRIYIHRFLKRSTWINYGKKYHINILEVNWVKINEII